MLNHPTAGALVLAVFAGGPAQILGWAEQRLADHGVARTGRAEQLRTWNLSAVRRIPTEKGPVWLKAVPDFFAPEGSVIDWIGARPAPRVIDFTRGRALMADIAVGAQHDVQNPAALRPMVQLLSGPADRQCGRAGERSAECAGARGCRTRRCTVTSTP